MQSRMFIVKCSRCRRIRVNSNWVNEPEFLSKDFEYSHTFCPSCLPVAMAQAEAASQFAEGLEIQRMPVARPVTIR